MYIDIVFFLRSVFESMFGNLLFFFKVEKLIEKVLVVFGMFC